MKFSEYPYKRINLKNFQKDTALIINEFVSCKDGKKQIEIIKNYQKIQKEILTYIRIANVNFARNTKNKKNIDEKKFYDEIMPEIAAIDNQFTRTINNSNFKNELVEKFGKHYFDLIKMELKAFDPKIVPLMKQENDLVNKYNSLIASAEIEFNGQILNLTGLDTFKQDLNRDVRRKAFKAMNDFFTENKKELDEIFDKLVKIRHQKSQILGFKNFIPLAYLNMKRSDYGPSEIKEYRKKIVQYIVPLASKMQEETKKRFNYKKIYCHDTLLFKDGNPKPKGDTKHLISQAQKMYRELSKETGEFFDIMIDEELMDLENRAGKSGGGFCTSFPSLERPYIFTNFNGTDHDITVLTHEAGHAFQAYQIRKNQINRYLSSTAEVAEIHSMSMEFLTWDWMHLFFKKDTKKFLYKHLSDSLTRLVWMAIVDHFQHWVYENPNVSPKERKKEWSRLEKIYFPGLDYDNLEFFNNGGFWQKQLHIFNFPFYYIDYALAQICALQFWIRMQEDKKSTWSDYLKLCRAGGSMPFLDLVKLANIKSPFNREVFKEVANKTNDWLSEKKI